ncbi:MAG: uncharacterized protein QOD06_11, partial [Candidatus Binatota bacterium]|nr:uncharacterized protein [Candidatus Binatota bacterium]
MLDRLESLIVRRPRSVVALVALVTAILAVFAVRIRLDGSVETVLPRNDPEKRYYDEVRRLFGSDEVGVVALITANVYEPKTLEKLGRLTEEIGKVEGVEAAYSLTNAVDPIADVLDPPPLIPAIPRSREEEQELRQKIADRPIYLKNLVSADGRAAAINILFAAMNDDEFRRRGIDERIEAIVERERGADELYYTGLPHLKVTTVRAMWQDLTRLVPVTVAIIVLVLLASFRSVRGVLLPVATVTITLVWTLGVMVLTGRRLTIGTFPLPPLLLVIGTAYALHVVAESIERSRSGGEVADTVLDAVRRMRLPVFVAALTTALGFLSLAVNPISSIREMGIYASIGVAIAGA